jgi:hypothetical protein
MTAAVREARIPSLEPRACVEVASLRVMAEGATLAHTSLREPTFRLHLSRIVFDACWQA